MTVIKLDWDKLLSHVNSISKESTKEILNSILTKHSDLFTDEIGKVKGMTATLTLKSDTKPKFMKARLVPYSLKPKIEK